VQEEQASNTNSTSSVGTSYADLVLNTEDEAGISSASLSSNQVSLPAGTYEVMAWVPFALGSTTARDFRTRLYNITDGAMIAESQTMRVQNNHSVVTIIRGKFTLAATKTVSLQARCTTTGGTIGNAGNIGAVELYSILEFRKVA
jgi:hypothetical protein